MAPVSWRARIVAAVLLVGLIAAVYAALGAAGLAPMPSSIYELASHKQPVRGLALVSGYYFEQPFVSIGSGLPPYAFAARPAEGAPAVRVQPTLGDLRAGRTIAIIDAATGDGSVWSPYWIRTVAPLQTFISWIAVASIALAVAALLVGGVLAPWLRLG